MKKFIRNSVLFSMVMLIMVGLVVWLASTWVARQPFGPSNTESNLMVIEKNKAYDYLFLGNSHARNFSRHGNHRRMEKALNKNVLNLGQGLGICGANDQTLFLKYALSEGVKFRKLIYVLSPPFLYGNHLNASSKTFFQEPVQLNFLVQALKHPAPNKMNRIHHYLRSKITPYWLSRRPGPGFPKLDSLVRIDEQAISRGFELAFPLGRSEQDFSENVRYVEEAMALAKSRDAEIIFLSTPTLFGHWPGQERVARYCDSLTRHNQFVQYIDCSNEIKDPNLYYDHHHLNSKGIDSLVQILKHKGL